MVRNFFLVTILLVLSLFAACTEKEDYTPAGGNLPGSHIIVQPNGKLVPADLTISSGDFISFVNNDVKPHRFMSADSISIVTPTIAPYSFFVFKNDIITGLFSYRCLLDTSLHGTITIRP